ncbi:TetR/AcrR family transcriptional regulator [Streptacidiphilus cavernicola]|uniref:TetR/AcrR family transcriptional regulator n=1 Tax=Streptacidiphilus cavernicola TaxID=3342716 RepID=A0ABV6VU60_9ACTN
MDAPAAPAHEGTAAAAPEAAGSRAARSQAAPAAPAPDAAAQRPRRAPYRRLPVEQRREQLIAVALELFSRHAPEEVSLDDVALAAEASRPLVYRYFPGGKQQLYEAALRSAADELSARFVPPAAGGPTERLGHVLDQYFGFVGEHAAGYAALLRGGSVAETERTTAIVDQVRRAAHRSILEQLRVPEPGPRLVLLVRSWISVVETTALTWLDDGRGTDRDGVGPAAGLRDWLVDEFVAMFAVAALHDPETERVLRAMLAGDGAEAGAALVTRLGALLTAAAPAGSPA